MKHENELSIANRSSVKFLLSALAVVYLVVSIFLIGPPLVLVDFERFLSWLPLFAIFYLALTAFLFPLIMLVPSRVTFNGSAVVFRGLLGGKGLRMQTHDIQQIKYQVTQRNLRKPLENRVYFVDMEFGYRSKVRRICDGPVVAQLMKTVPRDRSKLVVVLSGGKTEEREVSESDWM